jgi:hypothetical protein
MKTCRPALAAFAAATLWALASTPAWALFKVVGPDGRVTYTDRPPPSSEGKVMPVNRDTGVASDPALPFALRQVVTRFPVVLYTAVDCGNACELGRALLSRRGIPYSERSATTTEEREAWERIVGGSQAPTLTVGSQSLRGFSPASWEETLDLAGYPRASQLPATYKAAVAPLIAPRVAAPAPAAPARPQANETAPNPSGIRF